MKKHEFITKNFEEMKRLTKNGMMSPTMLAHHSIYQCYQNYSNLKSKMLRYQCASNDCKVSVRTVIAVVQDMERNMKG